jgi:3-oxoacyl-[acyl-carrier-protein] synthase II
MTGSLPRQVVITGYDQVSSLGSSLAELDDALWSGKARAEAYNIDLPGLDPSCVPICRCTLDIQKLTSPSRIPMDRGTALALWVAMKARAASDWGHTVDAERLGVYWGSGMAGAQTFDLTSRPLYAEHKRLRPTNVITAMPNAPNAEIALWSKAKGTSLSYACACASSAVAIGEAMLAIRNGRLDIAIVGGSESMLTPGVISSWQAMRVLAQIQDDPNQACRPFDVHRTGFALGEGAAALILESEDHAIKRHAQILARLSGYGTSSDGVHMTNPDPDGQMRAMRAALMDAKLQPTDIGYINAHGTATTAGDLAESLSIGEVFQGHPVPVSSSKGLHGHLLGAGGALELVVTLRALHHQRLPVSANLKEQDPAISLNLVKANTNHFSPIHHAMSNSFAFGGTNAALIVSV